MPANLPPAYFEAEAVYRQASTPAEKIEALQAMLAVMPKHKGTDHLKADLRARIARLTQEAERRGRGPTTQIYSVRKEGAGQVALIGPPNVGKSQLLAALTDAQPKIAPYPFTTQLPQPAMMPFENVNIQLVDLPPITEQETHAWMRPIIRQADLLLLVVDLSEDPLSDLEATLAELEAVRVEPVAQVEPGTAEGLLLQRRALVVANKLDAPGADEVCELLLEEVAGRWPVVAVSAVEPSVGRSVEQTLVSASAGAPSPPPSPKGRGSKEEPPPKGRGSMPSPPALSQGERGLVGGLERLRRRVFERLEIVRVHTKAPGREVDLSRPVVLPAGSNLEDLAEVLPISMAGRVKYARVWGSGKFQGQRVSRSYEPRDGDIVELYA